jgi:8-oxo-dGTP pyrophosphatase MutT (NUDIX family)
MDEEKLVWREESKETVFTCPVFSVTERKSRSPAGEVKAFSVLESGDWAIVMPVLVTERGEEFVMVRQWRHGAQRLSLEFPGGVIERGETAAAGAARELREETGFIAGELTCLGRMSPNPAIMSNQVHFFLARALRSSGSLDLDEDEYVNVETVPVPEVLASMGRPPYIHALMAAALCFFSRIKEG